MKKNLLKLAFLFALIFVISGCGKKPAVQNNTSPSVEQSTVPIVASTTIETLVIDCGFASDTDELATQSPAQCFFDSLDKDCQSVKVRYINGLMTELSNNFSGDQKDASVLISANKKDGQCVITEESAVDKIICNYNKSLLDQRTAEYMRAIAANTIEGAAPLGAAFQSAIRLMNLHFVVDQESIQGYADCTRDSLSNIGKIVYDDDSWSWTMLDRSYEIQDIAKDTQGNLYVLKNPNSREDSDYFIIEKYNGDKLIEKQKTPKLNLAHPNTAPKIYIDKFSNILIYNLNYRPDLNIKEENIVIKDFQPQIVGVPRNHNLLFFDQQTSNWLTYDDKDGEFGNIHDVAENTKGLWFAVSGGNLLSYNYTTWNKYIPTQLGLNTAHSYSNLAANDQYIIMFEEEGAVLDIYENKKFATFFVQRQEASKIDTANNLWFNDHDAGLTKYSLESKKLDKVALSLQTGDLLNDQVFIDGNTIWLWGQNKDEVAIAYRYLDGRVDRFSYNSEPVNTYPRKIIVNGQNIYALFANFLYKINIKK